MSCLLLSGTLMADPVRAQDSPAATVTELRFADLFATPVGPNGLQPGTRLLAADGQRVRITGYMVAQERPRPGRFFLTPRPLVMSEHADGDADDLPPGTVLVLMPPLERDVTPLRTRGLLQLTGTLQVGREEHDDGRVSWVRLLLDPRPVAPSTP